MPEITDPQQEPAAPFKAYYPPAFEKDWQEAESKAKLEEYRKALSKAEKEAFPHGRYASPYVLPPEATAPSGKGAHMLNKLITSAADMTASTVDAMGIFAYNMERKHGSLWGEGVEGKTYEEWGGLSKIAKGIRTAAEIVSPDASPQFEEDWIANDVPAAFGSAFGFLKGGWVAKKLLSTGTKKVAPKVSGSFSKSAERGRQITKDALEKQAAKRADWDRLVGTGAMGMAVSSTEGWMDAHATLLEKARQEGRTSLTEEELEQAWTSAQVNSLGGLTEIGGANRIGIKLLAKMDKQTRGEFGNMTRSVLHRMMNPTTVTGAVVSGTIEESGQEMVQTLWLNIGAAQIAKYDENRELYAEMMETGRPAGVVGAVFSGLFAAMNRKGRLQQRLNDLTDTERQLREGGSTASADKIRRKMDKLRADLGLGIKESATLDERTAAVAAALTGEKVEEELSKPETLPPVKEGEPLTPEQEATLDAAGTGREGEAATEEEGGAATEEGEAAVSGPAAGDTIVYNTGPEGSRSANTDTIASINDDGTITTTEGATVATADIVDIFRPETATAPAAPKELATPTRQASLIDVTKLESELGRPITPEEDAMLALGTPVDDVIFEARKGAEPKVTTETESDVEARELSNEHASTQAELDEALPFAEDEDGNLDKDAAQSHPVSQPTKVGDSTVRTNMRPGSGKYITQVIGSDGSVIASQTSATKDEAVITHATLANAEASRSPKVRELRATLREQGARLNELAAAKGEEAKQLKLGEPRPAPPTATVPMVEGGKPAPATKEGEAKQLELEKPAETGEEGEIKSAASALVKQEKRKSALERVREKLGRDGGTAPSTLEDAETELANLKAERGQELTQEQELELEAAIHEAEELIEDIKAEPVVLPNIVTIEGIQFDVSGVDRDSPDVGRAIVHILENIDVAISHTGKLKGDIAIKLHPEGWSATAPDGSAAGVLVHDGPAGFSTIHVSVRHFNDIINNPLVNISSMLEEEIWHLTDAFAIYDAWVAGGRKGVWVEHLNETYREVYEGMSVEERKTAVEAYFAGDPATAAKYSEEAIAAMSPAEANAAKTTIAQEFVRMALQMKSTGRTTESFYVKHPALRRLMKMLASFYAKLTGESSEFFESKRVMDRVAAANRIAGTKVVTFKRTQREAKAAAHIDPAQRTLEGTMPAVQRELGIGAAAAPMPDGYKAIKKYLTEEESAKMRRDTADGIVKAWGELPPDADFEAAARMGEIKRGWYARAGAAMRSLFGVDTEQFVAVLAATSPQQRVVANMRMALNVWQAWLEAGRPPITTLSNKEWYSKIDSRLSAEKASTKAMLQRAGVKLHSHVPNIVRALQSTELKDFSGYKVESFRRNLLGDLNAVTNDVWMAQFGGVSKRVFETKQGYLAYTAKVRKVAAKMGWEPAEVQETTWSFFQTLSRLPLRIGRGDRGAVLEGMTDLDVAKSDEFATLLLEDASIKEKLKRIGIDVESRLSDGRLREGVEPREGSITERAGPRGGAALGRITERAGGVATAARPAPTITKGTYTRLVKAALEHYKAPATTDKERANKAQLWYSGESEAEAAELAAMSLPTVPYGGDDPHIKAGDKVGYEVTIHEQTHKMVGDGTHLRNKADFAVMAHLSDAMKDEAVGYIYSRAVVDAKRFVKRSRNKSLEEFSLSASLLRKFRDYLEYLSAADRERGSKYGAKLRNLIKIASRRGGTLKEQLESAEAAIKVNDSRYKQVDMDEHAVTLDDGTELSWGDVVAGEISDWQWQSLDKSEKRKVVAERMLEVMETLPYRERLVVEMWLDGVPHREVMSALGMRGSNTGNLLHVRRSAFKLIARELLRRGYITASPAAAGAEVKKDATLRAAELMGLFKRQTMTAEAVAVTEKHKNDPRVSEILSAALDKGAASVLAHGGAVTEKLTSTATSAARVPKYMSAAEATVKAAWGMSSMKRVAVAMTKPLPAGTPEEKAEWLRSIPYYHGTSAADEIYAAGGFDPNYYDYDALVGPGLYVTSSHAVASGGDGIAGYESKGEGVSPGTIPVAINAKSVWDYDAPLDSVPRKTLEDIIRDALAVTVTDKVKLDGLVNTFMDDLFTQAAAFPGDNAGRKWVKVGTLGHFHGEAMDMWYEASEASGVAYLAAPSPYPAPPVQDIPTHAWAVQEAMMKHGFDSITHVGGGIAANAGTNHRVVVYLSKRNPPREARDVEAIEGPLKGRAVASAPVPRATTLLEGVARNAIDQEEIASRTSGDIPTGTRPMTGGPRGFWNTLKDPSLWMIGGEDFLRKHGLNKLADGLREFFDTEQMLNAKLIRGFLAIDQKYGSKEMETGMREAEEYFRLRERGRADDVRIAGEGEKARLVYFQSQEIRDRFTAEAEAYLDGASTATKELIAWQKDMAELTGRTAEEMNVHVQDGGTWRPMVNLGRMHFPRMLLARTHNMIVHRNTNEYGARYQQLLKDMVENGNAETVAEAEEMLLSEYDGTQGGDYFANIEKARGLKLPDKYYDHTLEGYKKFLAKYSERIAQIHAFGQTKGGEIKDAWDLAKADIGDQNLVEELDRIQKAVYREQPRWTGLEGKATKLVGVGSMLYLSGPLTSVRNLISALRMNMETFGVWNTLAASGKLFVQSARAVGKTLSHYAKGDWSFKPWKKTEGGFRLAKTMTPEMVAEAHAAGALYMDAQIAQVLDIRDGDSIWNDPDSSGKAIREGNAWALWLHGVTERAGRAVSYTASLQWLRATREVVQSETGQWKQRLATLERLGFRGPELERLLAGDVEAGAHFARVAVREKQFSYDISQSPLMFTSPMGRMFLQFQRWGFQRLRDVARNVFKPAVMGTKVKIKGEDHIVRDYLPLVRMGLMSVAAGELYALLREVLYDRDREEATLEEISAAADIDTQRAIMLGLERAYVDMILDGGLGIVTDYGQLFKDMSTRGWRYKNPMEPPSIKFGKDIMGLVTSRVQRGHLWEGLPDDIGDFVRTIPLARTASASGSQVLDLIGADTDWVETQRAYGQRARLKVMVRRYVDEHGLDAGRPMFSGGLSKSPNTAIYDAMEEALLIGDFKEAREQKKLLLADVPAKDRDKLLKNLKASVRGRQPLTAKGVEKDETRERFKRWLKTRRPDTVNELLEVQRRYRIAAMRAGLTD